MGSMMSFFETFLVSISCSELQHVCIQVITSLIVETWFSLEFNRSLEENLGFHSRN